jgi:hypothetical protein
MGRHRQDGCDWTRGAAHLQTRQKSSAMNISRMSIAAVMGACDVGSATTCERHTGKWQHSAAKNALRCESVWTCCTCSQAAAVAEDEVGAKLPLVGLQPSPARFRCAALQHQPAPSRRAVELRRPESSFRLLRFRNKDGLGVKVWVNSGRSRQ